LVGELWELLKSAILGVAVALDKALRAEQEAERAVVEAWRLAAAQAVHQLTNKLTPVESWIEFARQDMLAQPEVAQAYLERSQRRLPTARAILLDFQRYASDKPFPDRTLLSLENLLQALVEELRACHFQIGEFRIESPVPVATVEVSLPALLEVFDTLAT